MNYSFVIPGLHTVERRLLEPPLPSFKTLQIFKALALVAGAAEVELLDVLIVAQLFRAAVEHYLALLHDVAMACHPERGPPVLFHRPRRYPELPVVLAGGPGPYRGPQQRRAR